MAKQKIIVALFTYGGGMRGLIPAHIMAEMESRTGLRMIDMIDIFTGPSTGAILNSALNMRDRDAPSRPRFRARHMVRFYEQEGLRIFPPDQMRALRGLVHDFNNRTMKLSQLNKLFRHGHYNPVPLHDALKRLYGDACLGDSLRSLVVPIYNIDGEQLKIAQESDERDDSPAPTKNNFIDEGGHAVWLKNIQSPLKQLPHQAGQNIEVHDAVRASCAAPTYFPCHHFSSNTKGYSHDYSGIDGSIFDNPCVSYHGVIRPHIPENTRLIMIVLGTGYTLRSFSKDDWNRYGALGVVDPVNDLPLINILFHASESALVDGFVNEMGNDLFLFNKSMLTSMNENTPSTQIDDANPRNLRRLKLFAQEIIEENASKFDHLCDLLVKNYEQNRSGKGLLSKILKS